MSKEPGAVHQLIYTTGINDFEAVRTLPNIIRLKNDRLDRNSGNRVVEFGDPEDSYGALDGIRIGRLEPKKQGNGSQDDEIPDAVEELDGT